MSYSKGSEWHINPFCCILMTFPLSAWCLMVQTVPIVFHDLLGWDSINRAGFKWAELTVFYSPAFIRNSGGSLQTIWEGSQVVDYTCTLTSHALHRACRVLLTRARSEMITKRSRPMFNHLKQFSMVSRGRKTNCSLGSWRSFGQIIISGLKNETQNCISPLIYLLLLLLIWAAVDLSAIVFSFRSFEKKWCDRPHMWVMSLMSLSIQLRSAAFQSMEHTTVMIGTKKILEQCNLRAERRPNKDASLRGKKYDRAGGSLVSLVRYDKLIAALLMQDTFLIEKTRYVNPCVLGLEDAHCLPWMPLLECWAVLPNGRS